MFQELLPNNAWLAFYEASARYVFLNWVFQASLLLTAGLMVSRLPRLQPAMRHRLLLGTLVGAALLPVTLFFPIRAAHLSAPWAPTAHSPFVTTVVMSASSPAVVGLGSGGVIPPATYPGLTLTAIWLLLGAGRLIRLSYGFRIVRHWGRRATPVDRHLLFDACRYQVADVDVVEADAILVPTVAGVLQPRILLPRGLAARLTAGRLRHVLLHEEAHVRRRDPLWFLVAECAKVLVGWHPLAEVVRQAVSRAAEDACDARVLANGAEGPEYARTLLVVLERSAPSPQLPAACPLGSPGAELRRRVSQILYGAPATSGLAGAVTVFTLAIAGTGALAMDLGSRPAPPASHQYLPAIHRATHPHTFFASPRRKVKEPAPVLAESPLQAVLLKDRGIADLVRGLPEPALAEYEGAGIGPSRARHPREGRTVVFLLDVSTSMHAFQSEARSGILEQIEQLGPSDQFNVLAFSTDVTRFAELPVAPGEDSLAAVRAWVNGLEQRPGTDLNVGIGEALSTPGVTSLVIYSDVNAPVGLMAQLALGSDNNQAQAQIFTVAFGEPVGTGSELFPGAARLAPSPVEVQTGERPDRDLQP